MTPSVQVYETHGELIAAAVQLVTLAARSAIAARGRWTVALAGGSTPRALYAALATPERQRGLDWSRAWVFWGDERCVPPDDEASNYRMAREALLAHVSVPESQVFRMEGELAPEAAAARYASVLRSAFEAPWPVFDTVLLGLGPDGHTVSLFPDTPLVAAQGTVAAGWVEAQGQHRITLTLPSLNAARGVVFLVTGEAKAAMVKAVLSGDERYPAARVRPAVAPLWLLDAAAASAL